MFEPPIRHIFKLATSILTILFNFKNFWAQLKNMVQLHGHTSNTNNRFMKCPIIKSELVDICGRESCVEQPLHWRLQSSKLRIL
jgi:hypothetical protein